ncbi:MAG: alanine racemase [Terriglobales bacterium]
MRTWIEVSLGALRRNWEYVRRVVPAETAICAVVKADAYGHGAVRCAQVFAAAGSPWLAVTSVEEGIKLRQAGLGARILVLAGFYAEQAEALIAHQLTPAVWDAAQIGWLAAATQGLAPGAVAVHLKLETGMGRLGVTADQRAEVDAALAAAPALRVEAVFSHLAASEAADPAPSVEQKARLAGLSPGRNWHLLNSEGALRWGWGGMMARVGLALYGYSAQPAHAAQLEPALRWKARVVAVKPLPAGHGVGYGPRFRTARASRLAVIAAGYADGYRRDFSPGSHILLNGQRAPVAGAVSMDLTCVDVTGLAAPQIGDQVELLGPALPATELAALAGTIPYEVLCGISARVQRRYVE